MKTICRILSTIFSPLLVPTYGLIIAFCCSMLSGAPIGIRVRITLICFAITSLVPLGAIMLMWRMGLVSEPGLNTRTERTIPYLISALSYGACAWALYGTNAPSWLWLFPIGGMAAVVINLLLNFKWKISAHMAAMGGLTALVFRMAHDRLIAPDVNFLWVAIIVVLATGLVGTARIYLERHTLLQVIAGAASGFLCVYIATMFG